MIPDLRQVPAVSLASISANKNFFLSNSSIFLAVKCMFEKPEKQPDMIKMLNVLSVMIIIFEVFFFGSFMVTHVVSWFGLAIDLVFFFIVFSFLLLWIFFVDKDDGKVVHVVWFNYCFCCCSQLFSSLCC